MQRNKRAYGSLEGGLDFSSLREPPTMRQPLSPATPLSDEPNARSSLRRAPGACTTPPHKASSHPWAKNGGIPPAPRAPGRRQMLCTPPYDDDDDDDEARLAKRQRRATQRDMQPKLLWPQSPSASSGPCAFGPSAPMTPPSAQRRLSNRLAARTICSRSSSPLQRVRTQDEGVAGLELALQLRHSINAPKSIAVAPPSCTTASRVAPQPSPPILQLRSLAARAPLRTRTQVRAAQAAASAASSSSNGPLSACLLSQPPICSALKTPCSPRARRDRSASCSSSTSGASNGRRCTPSLWRGSTGASGAWRGRGGTPVDYFGDWQRSGAIC